MDYKKNEAYKIELLEGLRLAGVSVDKQEPIDVLEDLYVNVVGEVSFILLQKYYGMNKPLNVIESPLTLDEVLERKDERNHITGILAVSIETLIEIDGDEGFHDYVCENLVGGRMFEVVYSLIDREGDTLYLEITGDVTPLLEDNDIEVA